MKAKFKDIYWLPSTVLFFLGILDVIRGFMHTFLLRWSAVHIAGFDPVTAPPDQFFLLGVFGISNFLTGFLYFLISRRAREISPHELIIIPLAYFLGIMGIRISQVHMQAAFEGQFFMFAYLALCVITFIVFLIQRYAAKKSIDST